jgi:hypothetical protein
VSGTAVGGVELPVPVGLCIATIAVDAHTPLEQVGAGKVGAVQERGDGVGAAQVDENHGAVDGVSDGREEDTDKRQEKEKGEWPHFG